MVDHTFQQMMSRPRAQRSGYTPLKADQKLKQEAKQASRPQPQPFSPHLKYQKPAKYSQPMTRDVSDDLRQWYIHLRYAKHEELFVRTVLETCVGVTLIIFFLIGTHLPYLLFGSKGPDIWVDFDVVVIISIIPQLMYWAHCHSKVNTYQKIIDSIQQTEKEDV